MTIIEEINAIMNYITVKNPGPIIRKACEDRITFLSNKSQESQGTKSKPRVPVVDTSTGNMYTSISAAARNLNISKDALQGDIYRKVYSYKVRPLKFA